MDNSVQKEQSLQREQTDQRERPTEHPHQRERTTCSPRPRTPKPDFTPIIRTSAQKLREQRTLRPRDLFTALEQGNRLIPTDVETRPNTGDYLDPLLSFWSNVLETATYFVSSKPDAEMMFIFKAKAKGNKDPDLFNWDEAMNSPYSKEFLQAAAEEIQSDKV